MPSADLLWAFTAAMLVFAFLPGPGVLYCVGRSLAQGWRAGLMAALGVHIGGYAHVIAAGFGLAVVFEAVPILYAGLKLAGALYLIWLGIGLIRQGGPTRVTPVTDRSAFAQSIVVEVLNPKTALFYLAFLPQFVDPDAALSLTAQLLILGIIVNVVFSIADVAYAMLAAQAARAVQGHATRTIWLRRLGGGVLIGLGAKLALERG